MQKRTFLSFGSIVLIILWGATGASASLLGDTAGRVASSVPNTAVSGTVTTAVADPVQTVTSRIPRGDSPPTPTASQTPVGTSTPSPAVDPVGSGVEESAEMVSGISADGAQGAGAGVRGTATRLDADGQRNADTGTRQIESGRPVPLRHWLAQVWPAIALGPVGELLTELEARWEAVAPLAASDLSPLPLGPAASGAGASGGPGPSISRLVSAEARGISFHGSEELPLFVLLLSSAALMALLVFAVRREMGLLHTRSH